MQPHVVAVHAHDQHAFSKRMASSIELIEGLGVRGDAHCGVTVRHRSRVAKDPTQPNLRQVHLIHAELFEELRRRDLNVLPGQLGENITTEHLDLLRLGAHTRLRIGADAIVEITGLRNPCAQIEAFRPGLLAAVLDRGEDGSLIRKAGVMGVVRVSGVVAPGDAIAVVHRPQEFVALAPV